MHRTRIPNEEDVSGRETSLTPREYQAVAIFAMHILEDLAFTLLHGRGRVAAILITVSGILNCCKNPVIYIIFNSALRDKMRCLLRLKSDAVVTVASSKQ